MRQDIPKKGNHRDKGPRGDMAPEEGTGKVVTPTWLGEVPMAWV